MQHFDFKPLPIEPAKQLNDILWVCFWALFLLGGIFGLFAGSSRVFSGFLLLAGGVGIAGIVLSLWPKR